MLHINLMSMKQRVIAHLREESHRPFVERQSRFNYRHYEIKRTRLERAREQVRNMAQDAVRPQYRADMNRVKRAMVVYSD